MAAALAAALAVTASWLCVWNVHNVRKLRNARNANIDRNTFPLLSPQLLPPGGVGDDREHQLTDVEGMTPVVVGHTSVISPDRAQPSRNKIE